MSDLQTAYTIPAWLTVKFKPAIELHRILSQRGHQLRGVRLEHQAGRVGTGTAGVEERPLVTTTISRQPRLVR